MNRSALALSLVALGLATLVTNPVRADGPGKVHLALDLDWADTDVDNGGGGALRLGYELDLAVLTLIPEVGGTYHGFPDLKVNVYRAVAGGRVRFFEIVEPGAYAHFGVGHLDSDRPLVASWTASTMDAGLLVDVTLLPMLQFGLHGGYNVQFGRDDADDFDWWTFGLNAALVF